MKFLVNNKPTEDTVEISLEAGSSGNVELLLSRPGGQRFVLGRFELNGKFTFIKLTATKFNLEVKEL